MVVTLNAPDKTGIKIPSAEEVNAVLQAVDLATIEPYKEKSWQHHYWMPVN